MTAAAPTRLIVLARSAALTLTFLGLVGRAWGQETPGEEVGRRSGAERQVVVQLAYALGEAHALHRLCAGPADATWYGRMQRLEAEESTNPAGRRQLVDAFNAGYAARRNQFPGCSRRSRAAEQTVAERGAALARRLAAPDMPPI